MKLNLRVALVGSGVGFIAALANAITLAPIADTRILSVFPNQNDGSGPILSAYNIGSSNDQHSLLLFDYSALSGETIVSATLRLSGKSFTSSTASVSTYIWRPTRTWSESQATWINAATGSPWTNLGGDMVGTTGSQLSNPFFVLTRNMTVNRDWYEFDVTSLVAGQVDGTWSNFGIGLSGNVGNHLVFDSMETDPSFQPQLVINSAPVPEPSGILVVVGLSGCLLRRLRKK